jgi:ADP-ribose pyrophosphatase YjhB (NUDIX family)
MVVGCIPEWGDRILICRRAIQPRYGRWTLPAGYLENGETVSEGAEREALEEAGARLENLKPYALFNLTFVNQVYLMFRASLVDTNVEPGKESLQVKLVREDGVPWKDIAFPVMRETLVRYFKDREKGEFSFHLGDIPRGW